MKKFLTFILILAAAQCVFAGELGDVYFTSEGNPVGVHRWFEDAPTPADMVKMIMMGPNGDEMEDGIFNAVPMNWVLDSVTENGAYLDINFKPVPEGTLYETTQIEDIWVQFDNTIRYKFDLQVRLFIDGNPLDDYEIPAPDLSCDNPFIPLNERMRKADSGPLSGKLFVVRGGHGYAWYSSKNAWSFERGENCSKYITREDLHTQELACILITYLEQEGASIAHAREPSHDRGNCSYTGKPWWQMSPIGYLCDAGYPTSVTEGAYNVDHSKSKYVASNLANYRGADLYISIHTNALSGDCYSNCGTGIETFYSSNNSASGSQRFAQLCLDNCISMVRTYYDSKWACRRSCKAVDANYAETKRATMPSTLFEFGFHDNCAKDAQYLADNFFRTVGMYGLAQAVFQYYGISPKWGPYSAEYISDTIPSQMAPGETKQVSITFKNHGFCWQSGRDFMLGAVDNSDPFAVTRQGLPGEIMPGQTCTFTFNMTAPSNPGVYTTDWQMLREGATWFGDKLSKQVTVGTPELGAVMVSNTIPDSAMQGETKSVSVTVKNVGNKTWTAGEKFVLGACGDGDPFASTTAFTVPKNVAKNETVTFTFNMSFPTAGTFTTDWQMAQQYVTWFGDKLSKNVTVTPVEERGAILVSNTIPDSANLGETRSVSITFRNVGSTTWTPETFFRLSALDDSDPFAESHRYYLDRAVPKGDTYTFTFDMHFNTAGTHTTDWQMVQDGVTRFGDILRKSVTVSAPEFGAQIIGETIPTSFATGETKKVTVTVKNTGSATWSQATEDMLGSLDNYDPFSLARIGLDTGERRVAPGETYTFTFYMTAPANPGVYTTDWQMIREHVTWFGDIIRKDVTVTAAEHSAQMISNTIPDSANADEVRTVSVTVKNTGTVTWTPEALFRLGAVDNNDPFYHAEPPRAYLDRAVAPGETYTFTFDMEFGEPGTYTTDWKMVQDGNDWFGQVLAKQVTVNRPEFNARILSDNIPTTMIVGQTKTVSVTVKNTGSATWSQGTEDMLGSPDNYDPFSLARIGLDTAERRVAPGETYTFTFPMTAPSKAGTYTTDWQMIREYVTWFGDVISKEIKVNEVGNAHTYYVATNGNDNNAGTEAAPWKTITNGDHKKILAPGDTVIVKAGTYTVTDCMNDYSVRLIECDGTAKYPITYKAQGTVKIVNNNSKNGNHDSHTTCLHVSSEHIVLDGFEFQGGVSPLSANYKFTGLIVKNCKIHDSDYITTIWPQSTGIYQENNNPITVENCEIYNIGLNAPGECFGIYNMGGFFNGSAGVSSTYHHNYIHNVKGGALSSRGGNCNDRFLNNTVVDCTSYGVRVNSGASINGSVTAKNNIFVNCGTAISLENDGCVANNSYNLFWNLGGGITNGTMGEGSVIANPSFTTAPTIADSSPAVNKGVDVGYAYKGGAPDMGCYETSYNRGVIYYVATNGNDDNAGTSAAPWKTILNGDHKKILRPGDTVIVKAGTYTVSGGYNDYDVRLIEVGGTADYPITYKAQGTVKVVNNGSGNEGHNKLTCSLHVSADYITLDGFEFTGGVAGVAANYRAKGMVVKNCKIHDTDYMTTIFPQSAGIYYGELDTIGLTVENCEIYNIGLNAPGEAYGIYNMSNYFNELPGSQSVIHHNYIHNIRGGALSVRGGGTNDLFLNNTCVDCVMFGVRTHIGDKIGGTATAKNNIFVNCGTALAQDNSDCGITNSNNLIWSCTSPTNGTLGANTVQANPKFTTAPTIASDSPAVNTGVNVGYAYKGTAPDMGCYETEYNFCAVSGTVTSSFGGGAVSGATVNIGGNTATTGSDGKYSIVVNKSASAMSVTATASGYASYSGTVTPSADTATLNITLTAGCTVSGKVSDSAGPVSGAKIKVNGSEKATTNSSGNYSFTVDRSNTALAITATAANHKDGTGSVTPNAATATCNITMVATCTVSGTVTDGNGGVAGAKVKNSSGNILATTDGSGNYSFTVDRSSTAMTVITTAADHRDGTGSVTPNAATATCDITMVATCTVSGTVTDSEGPVSGATVSVDGVEKATTDANGEYDFTVDRSGDPITVTVSAESHRDGFGTVTPGDASATCDIVLISTCEVTGTVISAFDGSVISGATVTSGEESVTTDEDGSYTITVDRAESAEISVSAEGYLDYTDTVEAVEAEAVLDVALDPADSVIATAGELKNAEVGDYVTVTFDAKAINGSADFEDYSVYIESGLFEGYKLIVPDTVNIMKGDAFNFRGVVRSDADGKYVEVISIVPKTVGEPVRVVGMTNNMLYSNALVRVWGKVTAMGEGSFTLTSASGSFTVKIEAADAPEVGDFAVITGIATENGVRAIEILK